MPAAGTNDRDEIRRIVQSVADSLAQRRLRLVLAESCTCGLVASWLGSVPGISQWFCGSAVTYREATKSQWLGVSSDLIHEHTAVSEAVACAMAIGVLRQTPEASLSLSVTGHLGPNAPALQDGHIYFAAAQRKPDGLDILHRVHEVLDPGEREWRREQAAVVMLSMLRRVSLQFPLHSDKG